MHALARLQTASQALIHHFGFVAYMFLVPVVCTLALCACIQVSYVHAAACTQILFAFRGSGVHVTACTYTSCACMHSGTQACMVRLLLSLLPMHLSYQAHAMHTIDAVQAILSRLSLLHALNGTASIQWCRCGNHLA